jgi:hypothetical protein
VSGRAAVDGSTSAAAARAPPPPTADVVVDGAAASNDAAARSEPAVREPDRLARETMAASMPGGEATSGKAGCAVFVCLFEGGRARPHYDVCFHFQTDVQHKLSGAPTPTRLRAAPVGRPASRRAVSGRTSHPPCPTLPPLTHQARKMKLPPGHVPGIGVVAPTARGGLGERLLRAQGWADGLGLGKDGQGRADAVSIAFKADTTGVSFLSFRLFILFFRGSGLAADSGSPPAGDWRTGRSPAPFPSS